MVSSRGFLQESLIKLKHKVLPPLQEPDNFLYIINRIFYNKTDHIWVAAIDKELWINLFSVLGIQMDAEDRQVTHQLIQALHILTLKIVTLGFEGEIITLMGKVNYNHNPFILLDRSVDQYLDLHEITPTTTN